MVSANLATAVTMTTQIELHARYLEGIADQMDGDCIGGHPTRGHAAVLRTMAYAMRADAAQGKTPHIFDDGGLASSAGKVW